jgi:AraC family transcriptional regulator of adaptative response/methylated-DNA-[protein]-cysteine methyltransferase
MVTMMKAAISPPESPRRPRLNEDACWQAVVERRGTGDGLFFVAVRTTGIYCRPGCPSRTPKRENVRFFASVDEAEAAGFRACKRCKPREPVRNDIALVQRICRLLDAADAPPTLAELGALAGISPFHLQRTFKRVTGLTPRRYAESRRGERLRTGLRGRNGIAAAVYDAGFGSSGRAYEHAPRLLGMTPARYRRGGDGMRIAYTIVTSPFGRMLVGATDRGICAVSFADADEPLVAGLAREYPSAETCRDDASMRAWVDGVIKTIEDGAAAPHLPLDIRATAFRARVWDALRAIPRGETRTYGEVARSIGRPKAARAVGQACATNPVAILIPCHRVIGSDGGLTGFASGVDRKRKILERESGAKGQD